MDRRSSRLRDAYSGKQKLKGVRLQTLISIEGGLFISILLEHEGVTYPSIKNFCIKNGLSYDRILRYIAKGCSVTEAIEKVNIDNVHPNYKKVEYEGKQYTSVRSLALHFDVPYGRLFRFIKRTNSVAEAMTI